MNFDFDFDSDRITQWMKDINYIKCIIITNNYNNNYYKLFIKVQCKGMETKINK